MLFYQLSSLDPYGSNPWKRSVDSPAKGTFEGDLGEFGMLSLKIDPDALFTNEQQVEGAKVSLAKIEAVDSTAEAGSILNPLPDG